MTFLVSTVFLDCSVDTAAGPVSVGAMICYDREFPESARALMLGGAELILVPSASSIGVHRLAAGARCGPGPGRTWSAWRWRTTPAPNPAIPWRTTESPVWTGRSRDTLVVAAGEREGIFPAHFDLRSCGTIDAGRPGATHSAAECALKAELQRLCRWTVA